MEIHQSAVILLLVLCVSFSTHAQPPHIKPRYQQFLEHHFDPKMSEQKCTRIRGILDGNGVCKPANTFIQANSDDIRKVCNGAGTPQGGDLFKSNQPFPVVTCKPNNKQRCKYDKGKKSNRYIVLGCAEGWPVHYDEGKLNP